MKQWLNKLEDARVYFFLQPLDHSTSLGEVLSNLLYATVIHTTNERNMAILKSLFWRIQPIIKRTRGWSSQKEHGDRKWRTREEWCLLIGLVQHTSFYNPGPAAQGKKYQWQWAVHLYIILHLRKCPTDMPMCQSDGANPSNEVPYSQVTPVCVNMTNKEKAHRHTQRTMWWQQFFNWDTLSQACIVYKATTLQINTALISFRVSGYVLLLNIIYQRKINSTWEEFSYSPKAPRTYQFITISSLRV